MRLTHLRVRYGRVGARSALLSTSWVTVPVPLSAPAWRPPADVLQGPDSWTVRLEIAGVREEEVRIALYEDSLVVEGTRPWPGLGPEDRVEVAELRYGRFRFELDLPPNLDRSRARATYDRGLLTLDLPRSGSAAP